MTRFDYRAGIRVSNYSELNHVLRAMRLLPFNWDGHFSVKLHEDTAEAVLAVVTKLKPIIELDKSIIELKLGRSSDVIIDLHTPEATYQVYVVNPGEIHLYTYDNDETYDQFLGSVKTYLPSSFGWKSYPGTRPSDASHSVAVNLAFQTIFG